MPIQFQNLKSLLLQLLSGKATDREILEIVHLSRFIVQSHLNAICTSVSTLCMQQGLTLTDIAFDAIGEAFARDEKGKFPILQNFVHSLDIPIEETLPENLFIAYKSFLLRVAGAQIARLFAENDPQGAKIHRNVREALKDSSMFSVQKDYRGVVLTPCGVDSNEHLPPFPVDELENVFTGRVKTHRTIPELLKVLHEVLSEQMMYRRSVPLIEVVQVFKRAFAEDFEQQFDHDHQLIFDGLTSFEKDRLRRQIETVLKEKILVTYLAKGKLARNEAEALFNALHDVVVDWCNGEESKESLFDYLKTHLSVDETHYEATLRAKVEYLVRIARDEFASRLLREM